MDLNKCIFIGRLASDPKLKEHPTDPTQTRCTFTLAVNRRFKKGKADFPRVVVWGEKKAKAVMEFCQKGKELTIVAEYQTEWYPPEKEGGEGVNFQIFRADEVIFGVDSQRVLREKERGRKDEMAETVPIYYTDKAENVSPLIEGVNEMLNAWARERHERGE